jgi:hypothetical protein
MLVVFPDPNKQYKISPENTSAHAISSNLMPVKIAVSLAVVVVVSVDA